MNDEPVFVPIPTWLYEQVVMRAAVVSVITGRPHTPELLVNAYVAGGLADIGHRPEEPNEVVTETIPAGGQS
jgi:hypothetical protein